MGKLLFLIILLCVLAFTQAKPRIVGGNDAVAGQFPYQVSLRYNNNHFCGGSIISPTIILSAAHCFYGTRNVSDMSVRAGSNHRMQAGVVVKVKNYIGHEDYNAIQNDIALVFLKKPLIFSKYIQAIPLASKMTPKGARAVLSGWGLLSTMGDVPQTLKYVGSEAMTTAECKKLIRVGIDDSVVCFKHVLGTGGCTGDSGGPAVSDNELVGVCSFNMNGCGSEFPDGYASVYHYLDWIKKNAGWV